jgi:hypothetical protein
VGGAFQKFNDLLQVVVVETVGKANLDRVTTNGFRWGWRATLKPKRRK